ncbi:MAG TPA: hypothetical protein VGF77_14230 [Allosphingosinicella sp.]|jgi:hypothetical protein
MDEDFPLSRALPALALAALALASCGGPKPLVLPADPVDRAATCGIVAAAEARSATADINQPLTIDAQGHILQHAMLAASGSGRFSVQIANAVSKRMSELQAEVTSGKWQDLEPACSAAFPTATSGEATLPKDRLDAQLGCSALAEFTASALESDRHYAAEISRYRKLRATLSDHMGPALRARFGSDLTKQRDAGDKAMAAMAELGSPVAVLDQCLKTFG